MAIIVKEGDHLKLTCAATGNPNPQISWNLKNGHAIPDGEWKRKQPFFSKTWDHGFICDNPITKKVSNDFLSLFFAMIHSAQKCFVWVEGENEGGRGATPTIISTFDCYDMKTL